MPTAEVVNILCISETSLALENTFHAGSEFKRCATYFSATIKVRVIGVTKGPSAWQIAKARSFNLQG